jgi:DNA-directed RNA polymerase subunit RPC12/RpoP
MRTKKNNTTRWDLSTNRYRIFKGGKMNENNFKKNIECPHCGFIHHSCGIYDNIICKNCGKEFMFKLHRVTRYETKKIENSMEDVKWMYGYK